MDVMGQKYLHRILGKKNDHLTKIPQPHLVHP